MANEIVFEIPKNLIKKFEKWKDQLPKRGYDGATIGGRFSYEFTPTGLGVDIWITDNLTDKALHLTEDVNW